MITRKGRQIGQVELDGEIRPRFITPNARDCGSVFQPAQVKSGSIWQSGIGMLLALLATADLFIPQLSSNAALKPTLVLLMICSILALIQWSREQFYLGRPHVLVFICSACFIPGIVFAGDNSYAASKVIGLFGTAVILVVSMQLLRPQRQRRAFVVALAFFGCVEALVLYLFSVTENARRTVGGLNAIGLGRMASLAALILILTALHQRGGTRVGLIGLAVAVTSASAATGSRGPLLSALIAALVVVAFNRSKGAISRILVLAVAGIAVYYAVTNLGDATANRLASTGSTGRGQLWRQSLNAFTLHPFGIGFGNLYQYTGIDQMAASGYAQYSHNMLLEAAVEGGIPALVGLATLLIVAFRALRRGATDCVGEIMLGGFLFAVVSASLSSDLVGNRLMFAMIGSGLALYLLPTATRPSVRSGDSAFRRTRPDTIPHSSR